jgi:hypothetical protein
MSTSTPSSDSSASTTSPRAPDGGSPTLSPLRGSLVLLAAGSLAIFLAAGTSSGTNGGRGTATLPSLPAGPPALMTFGDIPAGLHPSVRAPAKKASAYRLTAPDSARVEAVIAQLGMTEASRSTSAAGGLVLSEAGSRRLLHIEAGPSGHWTLHRGDPACLNRDDSGMSPDGRISCSTSAASPVPPAEGVLLPLEPLGPDAGPTPSRGDADGAVRELLDAVGVEVLKTHSSSLREGEGWHVLAETSVAGRIAVGLDAWLLVGRGGLFLAGEGWLGVPKWLGEYPLVEPTEAMHRLRMSMEDARAKFDPVEERGRGGRVTSMRLVLLREGAHIDPDGSHLVPAFVLDTDARETFVVPAVVDARLEGEPPDTGRSGGLRP